MKLVYLTHLQSYLRINEIKFLMIKVVIVGVLFIVNTKTFSQQTLLGGITHNNSSSGSWSLGYTFTPNKNITVTAFRRYFGTKITLWDNVGNVLATQNVSGTNGVWSNHLLGTPVLLLAGQTYKIAAVSGGGNYYWVSPIPSTTFTDGTFSSALEGSGDVNPINPGSGTARWLVDIVYTACSPSPAPPVVTNNGPRCPGATANLSVEGLAPGGNYLNLTGNGSGSDIVASISNNFTVDFWVNPTQTRAATAQSNSGTAGVNAASRWAIYPWHGGIPGNNRAGMGVSVGTNGISVGEHADSYLPTNLVWTGVISGWTHVAVVYTNRVPSLYVNGTLVATGVVSGKATVYPSVGSNADASYGVYHGGLDNIRYWNRVLSAAEIQSVRNYEITPAGITGLVAQYKFNNTLNDNIGTAAAWGSTSAFSAANYYTYTWSGPGTLPAASTSETQSATLPSTAGPWAYTVSATIGSGCANSNIGRTMVRSGLSSSPLETTVSSPTTCGGTNIVMNVNNQTGRGGEIDRTTWTVGSGSAAGFSMNGVTNENFRLNMTNPWGNTAVGWEARPIVGSPTDADGGWNGSLFPVDNSKVYRFSVWVKRSVVGNGLFYLGVNGFTGSTNTGVIVLSNGATDTNPYFWYGGISTQDEWMLVVGHVYPYTHTGTTSHPQSGIYSIKGGVQSTLSDYKWLPSTTHAVHRSYLYYSSDPATRQQFLYPRVDILDGSEPTIQDLLNGFDERGGLSTAGTWNWFSSSCGGTSVGSGNSITVAPSASTRYFVRAQDGCGNTVCKEASVILNPSPTTPTITADGATTFCVGNSVGLTARSSTAGGALSFNGSNHSVDLGNPADLKVTKNVTIEMWLKPAAFAGRTNPISKAYGGEYTFTLEPNGTINCYFGLAGGNTTPYMGFNTITSLTLNQWNHVAFVRENNVVRWYINGVQTNAGIGSSDPGTYVFSTPLTAAQSSGNVILGTGYAGFYSGEMDELRIWNVARTAAQISGNMNRPLNGSMSGLVGYWRFDEPSGTTVLDASGFSQSGTIINNVTRIAAASTPLRPDFSWSPSAGLNTTTDSTVIASPLTTTTYTVAAVSPFGCTNTTNTQVVTVPTTASALSLNNESASCVVRNNNWIHFQHSSGRLIASVQANYANPNTTITTTSYVGGAPISVQDCQSAANSALNKSAMQRSWVMNASPAIAGNVTVRLYFSDSELISLSTAANSNSNPDDNVNTRADLQLTKYSGSNQDGIFGDNSVCGWGGTLPSAAITRHTQTANGTTSYGTIANSQYVEFSINSFSELWLHGGASVSPLPVELLYFLGKCENGRVNLSWSTASEQNNAFFIVESSKDGENWEFVERVSGAGNSNYQLLYTTKDSKIKNGDNYYRLSQQDLDGTIEVLGFVDVSCKEENENTILLYPNPASEKVTIDIGAIKNYGASSIRLMDATGRVIRTENLEIIEGIQTISLDVSSYTAGTYFVQLSSTEFILPTQKLIIRK